MSLSANDWMMIWGGGFIVLAILIMWRTSRYDLKGAAFNSAWQVARGKRTAENPTEIEKRLGEITVRGIRHWQGNARGWHRDRPFRRSGPGHRRVADALARRCPRGGRIFLDVRSHDDHSISK